MTSAGASVGPRRIGWPSTPCLWTPLKSAEIRTAADVQPDLAAAVQAGDRWLLQADQGAERPQLPTVRLPRATAAAFSDDSVDLSTGSIPLRSPTSRSCSTGHTDGAILSQFKDGSVVSPRLSWPALTREAGLEPLGDLPRHLYRVNAPMGAATKQPGPLEWPGVDSLQHDADAANAELERLFVGAGRDLEPERDDSLPVETFRLDAGEVQQVRAVCSDFNGNVFRNRTITGCGTGGGSRRWSLEC